MKKSANADEVYNAVVKKIGMSKKASSFFYLFEIVEYNFGKMILPRFFSFSLNCFFLERKLQPTEYPHNLYIQNYSTATSTCLSIRKWLFSINKELSLMSDPQIMSYIFWQVCVFYLY